MLPLGVLIDELCDLHSHPINLRELEASALELGQGFSCITRQKRMSIGADEHYLALLF